MKTFLLIMMFLSQFSFANGWVDKLKLPAGFKVIKTFDAPGARQMALSPSGILYVGTMDQGKVYAINKEGKVTVIFEGLNNPQGVLWHKNDLYIAEIGKISKAVGIDKNYAKTPKLVSVKDDFPSRNWHGWKSIDEGPDGKLYVPVGAPCNVCEQKLPFAALHRMDFDGKNFETVAMGIRNTVGFTWHPETKVLYFTEMGRDMMGDDVPPDEINVITKPKEHFGFPYLHAEHKDPVFGSKIPKGLNPTPPVYKIQAHSAPIGIAFFPKDKYPKEFENCFMVAEHGSWNRSKKSGYQISKGCLKNGKISSYKPFITGFKEGEKSLARPVHFEFLDDGSFYLSEDEPGTILHIKMTGK